MEDTKDLIKDMTLKKLEDESNEYSIEMTFSNGEELTLCNSEYYRIKPDDVSTVVEIMQEFSDCLFSNAHSGGITHMNSENDWWYWTQNENSHTYFIRIDNCLLIYQHSLKWTWMQGGHHFLSRVVFIDNRGDVWLRNGNDINANTLREFKAHLEESFPGYW